MRKILIVIIAIISINSALACGYAGGELSYVNIGGSNYKVTLTAYNELGANFISSAIINFECSTGTYPAFSIVANEVSLDSNIVSICNLVSDEPNYSYVPNLVKHTFEAIVVLPPCGNWNMYWTGDWRHAIGNTVGGGNCYINAELNNSVVNNSSPVFDNHMLAKMGYNSLSYINYGGQDPDGDSLSYSLFIPFNFSTTVSPIIFKPAYSATNFINSFIPIVLDSITGILKIQPSQYMYGTYGIEVKEWRKINGVMTNISTIHRDFTFSVCNLSAIPILSGFNFDLTNSYSSADTIYDTYRCFDGNPITFRINGFDADNNSLTATDNLKIFSISWSNALDNTVFTAHNNGTDSAYGEFVWTPDSSDFNKKNSFVVNVSDSTCPYIAINSRHYSITLVEYGLALSSDTVVCYGDNINIASSNSDIYNYFNWTIDGNVINGFSDSEIISINSGDYPPGVHIVVVEALDSIYGSPCSQIEQMTLTIEAPAFEIASFPDTAYCAGDNVTFDAGNAITYKWINSYGTVVSTDRFYSPLSTGMLFVEAYNNSCTSKDAFDVIIHNPPTFSFGNDTTITTMQTLLLEMPAGFSDYLWSDGSTGSTLLVNNDFDWQNAITARILEGGICATSDTIIVRIGNVGITDIKSSEINIYPNPVNDVLYIVLDKESENVKFQLYDITSKLIRDEVFSGKELMLSGLSVLPSGNYILKISIDNKVMEYKVIKK